MRGPEIWARSRAFNARWTIGIGRCGPATLHIERDAIQIQHVFDTDDAALHAATAGLGMVLAPAFLTEREIRSGGLVALPGFGPVDLGHYRVVFQRHENRMTRKFRKWLGEEMQRMV